MQNGVMFAGRWLAVFVCVLTSLCTRSALAVAPTLPSAAERSAFEDKILAVPLPRHGCFVAKFGHVRWRQITCGTAPKTPNPMAQGPKPNNVGAGRDYFAQSAGHLSSVKGSFDSISGVTALYGPTYSSPTIAHSNVYSLQMNANVFSTSACGGSPNCSGWEQFLYSQTQCGGPCIFIEYWLLNHTSPCPAGQGWYYWNGAGNTVPGCYLNTVPTKVPPQPLSDLGGLRMTGTVAGNTDTVSLSVANGTVYAASNASIAGLGQGWKSVEYNLVGDCCAYGTYFTKGPATLNIRVAATDGTQNAPSCLTYASGATAETNNLDLIGSCKTFGGAQPAIAFTESGGGLLPPGISQGDTHLITIGGTHYDLQETGEFILAQAGTDLIVQTRQDFIGSNQAVTYNVALAVQMGRDLIILYPNGDLAVNLAARQPLADGGSIPLDADVTVSRQGNLYTISRPSGDTVQATTQGNYLDLSVQLGAAEAPHARGLLISQSSGALASNGGAMLRGAMTAATMHDYVESWRVDSTHSLFPADGRPKASGMVRPRAADMPTEAAIEAARKTCIAAGVKGAILQKDCALDVAISGNPDVANTFFFTPRPKRAIALSQTLPNRRR